MVMIGHYLKRIQLNLINLRFRVHSILTCFEVGALVKEWGTKMSAVQRVIQLPASSTRGGLGILVL